LRKIQDVIPAEASANGQTATGASTVPATVTRDVTPPSLAFRLPERYRQNALVAEPLRHGLSDDADLVILSGNPEAGTEGSKALRRTRGLNVFAKAGFTAEAEVTDATGISLTLAQTASLTGSAAAVTIARGTLPTPPTLQPQVLTFSGFASLEDSLSFSAEDLSVDEYRGRYRLRVTLQDRAGNPLQGDQFALWVDTQAPTAQVGIVPYAMSDQQGLQRGAEGTGTQIAPGRFIVATFDCAEAWQGEAVDENNPLLRLAGTPNGLPAGATKQLSGWRLHTPVPIAGSGSGETRVVLRDHAGNRSAPSTITFQRLPIIGSSSTSEDPVPAPPPSEAVIVGDRLLWRIDYNDQDLGMGSPERIADASLNDSTVTIAVATHDSKGARISVTPIDPGPDGDRLAAPPIVTVPPSWATVPVTIPFRVHDRGLLQNAQFPLPLGTSSRTGTVRVGLRRPTYDTTAIDRTQQAIGTLTGAGEILVNLSATRATLDPGMARVAYGSTCYGSVTGFRWVDAIKLSPDVVATGNRVTVALEAGFLNKDFTIKAFQQALAQGEVDYVRFRSASGATVMTLPYGPGTLSTSPDVRKDKIAIMGLRLIAEGPNASTMQRMELDVEIGSEVPAGLYHVDVKCGQVKAYSDSLSQLTAGANGSHRMKGALRVIGLEMVRGDVDPMSGRAALGGKERLHPIGDDPVPTSDPAPHVVIDELSVGTIRMNASKRLVTDLHISGTVTFALADMVPDGGADPTQVVIAISEAEVATIPLERVAEEKTLLRPYACRFTFSRNLTSVPLVSYDVPVLATVTDLVTGNVGTDRAKFVVEAARNRSSAADASTGDSYLIERGLSQPVEMRLDFGGYHSLQELVDAGPAAIGIAARRTYENSAGSFVTLGGISGLVISAGNPSTQIAITSATTLGLESDVLGRFAATISVPTLYPGNHEVVFEETSVGSNVFCTRLTRVTMSAPSIDEGTVDMLTVELRKSLWDVQGPAVALVLAETGIASRLFTVGGTTLAINDSTGLVAAARDQMSILLSSEEIGTTAERIDLVETGVDSRQFTSADLFGSISLTDEYSDAWSRGPWTTSGITHFESSSPGPFIPLMVSVRSDDDLVAKGVRCEVFGVEHDLISRDGDTYSSGSGDPGVFATVGNLAEGDVFGAGHVSKKDGFVWATLKGSAVSGELISKNFTVYRASRDLFREMRAIATLRRAVRLGASPGPTYLPPYTAPEPADRFVDLMWSYIVEAKTLRGSATVTDAVRRTALSLMSQNDPRVAVIGIPHSPNHMVARAVDAHVYQVGSKYLIGHWDGVNDQEGDFASQRQNITHIIHFNTGLGWGVLKPKITSLIAVMDATYATESDKATAIMNWLDTNGYFDALSPEAKAKLASYDRATVFDYKVKDSHQWKELVDILTMARAFAAHNGGAMTALDLFLAYDIASGEAFHVFGIDPLNDVVITQAGAEIAEALIVPGSPIIDKPSLKVQLEAAIKTARGKFLTHPLNRDRRATARAFFSVMMAVDESSTTPFIPVKIPFGNAEYTIWKATIGTVVQSNLALLATDAGRTDFIKKVANTIKDRTIVTLSDPKANLTAVEVEALHQVVEVLMLIDDPIPGRN
jgi:hypothetical protein